MNGCAWSSTSCCCARSSRAAASRCFAARTCCASSRSSPRSWASRRIPPGTRRETSGCTPRWRSTPRRSCAPGTQDDPALMYAVLCHDFGKPEATRERDGRVVAHGHEAEGVAAARRFLERLRAPNALTAQVLALVEHHRAPAQLPRDGAQAEGVSPARAPAERGTRRARRCSSASRARTTSAGPRPTRSRAASRRAISSSQRSRSSRSR